MSTTPATPPSGAAKRRKQSTLVLLADLTLRLLLVALIMAGTLSLVFFPWSTDSPLSDKELVELRRYYAAAYETQGTASQEPEDPEYVRIAKAAAEHYDVKGAVTRFAATYGLQDRKVLDVGAGRGYLQDVVANYTALDISSSARTYFHKPFVLGSATAMPFADNEFDGAWTIWVLEHVPNPEAALSEIRRVVKDGGYLYLAPAWDCSWLESEGYPVRPYSDLGMGGKIVKATIPIQLYLWNMSAVPVRMIRHATWKSVGGPTRLRYRRLTPNYRKYWMADSDALNSLSRVETAMWFLSRGDQCLNCREMWDEIGTLEQSGPLILRIRKSSGH